MIGGREEEGQEGFCRDIKVSQDGVASDGINDRLHQKVPKGIGPIGSLVWGIDRSVPRKSRVCASWLVSMVRRAIAVGGWDVWTNVFQKEQKYRPPCHDRGSHTARKK